MINIAKVIGRLLGVLVNKGVLTKEEAEYIIDPVEIEEAENEQA